MSKKKDPSKKSKGVALLIIDMINELDFPEGKTLLRNAIPAAKKISALKEKFRKKNFPVIYVNDNFEYWKADWKVVYQKCSREESRGSELAKLLEPEESDYFILKPKHSGFYLTPLDILLESLKVKKLVITGIAGNICVLFTAHDAHMRGYKVLVPRDCIASNKKKENQFTLNQLSKALKLDTRISEKIKLN